MNFTMHITRMLIVAVILAIPMTATAKSWEFDSGPYADGHQEQAWFDWGGVRFEVHCFSPHDNPDDANSATQRLEVWIEFEGRNFYKKDDRFVSIQTRFDKNSPFHIWWYTYEDGAVGMRVNDVHKKIFIKGLLTSDTMRLTPPEDAVSAKSYTIPLEFDKVSRRGAMFGRRALHTVLKSCNVDMKGTKWAE